MSSKRVKISNKMYEKKNASDEDIPTIDTRTAQKVEPSIRGRGNPKDVNLSGLEYVHFGNTFVSYGVINVDGNQLSQERQPNKPDNVLEYLKLDEDLPYNINRTPRRGPINFNNARTPITINSKPINIKLKSGELDLRENEQKEKMKMYIMIGVYAFLALILLILLFFVVFGFNRKPNQTQYIVNTNTNEKMEPEKPIPRAFNVGNCETKVYKDYVKKTRLRLIVTKALLYYCSNDDDEMACYEEFNDEYNFHRKNNFKDIYFNYIINSKGKVFNGRSIIDCPYDEKFLNEDVTETHDDVITVGIGYCFNDRFAGSSQKTSKELSAIKKLIYYLQNSTPGRGIGQLLENEMTLEIMEECKGSDLANGVLGYSKKIRFWKPDNETPSPLKDIIYFTPTNDVLIHDYSKPIRQQEYYFKITDLDNNPNFVYQTCDDYSRSIIDYIVLPDGSYCIMKDNRTKEEYNLRLLSNNGLNGKLNGLENTVLIRNYEKWKRQEKFLKSVWKLSKDILSKYGNKRIAYICKHPYSLFKIFYPILSLTFNAFSGEQSTNDKISCPNIVSHYGKQNFAHHFGR